MTQIVPTMFIRLLKLPPRPSAARPLLVARRPPRRRALPSRRQGADDRLVGPIIHEYYASTEGDRVRTLRLARVAHPPGTVGQPLFGPIHVVDEDGDERPAARRARLLRPVPTSSTTTTRRRPPAPVTSGCGWSTLGDIGHLDEDGFLFLTDRRPHDHLRRRQRLPAGSENVLAIHPMVTDVAVFGVPDDDFGEGVHAVVRLSDGIAPTRRC